MYLVLLANSIGVTLRLVYVVLRQAFILRTPFFFLVSWRTATTSPQTSKTSTTEMRGRRTPTNKERAKRPTFCFYSSSTTTGSLAVGCIAWGVGWGVCRGRPPLFVLSLCVWYVGHIYSLSPRQSSRNWSPRAPAGGGR